MIGKILYGALFVAVLPCLLILWAQAASLNVSLPAYANLPLGYTIAACGLGLMLVAMRQLWLLGGGLPMNAFPPARLVRRGVFCWLPHPIYTGFVALSLGVSILAGSAAGLWLVTPSVLLASVGLVLGYERPDLRRRFGDTLHVLSPDGMDPPTAADRIRFLLVVIAPCVALYVFTFRLRFEDQLPAYPWTAFIYLSACIASAAAPWCARTQRDLRQFSISAWVATAVAFPIYWVVPSFFVLLAILAGRLFRPRWLGVVYASAVAISCATAGMRSVLDVLAALVLAPLVLQPTRCWDKLLQLTEWFANSWREWRFGPLRIINHGIYAGLAASVQFAVVSSALGPGREWIVLVTAVAGLLGAGAWAQWVEGSSLLRRPFGFYGGLIGVGLACLFFDERWTLLGAQCLSAPWMQAIGRLRCLVNGCCHGAPAPPGVGIHVTHARSRVTRLTGLTGVGIHPTQLYSILSNALLGLVLMRPWFSGSPLSLVCGIYAIGNGIARFVEEAYRGEPQTLVICGLRLYQWIAVGSILVGALLTTLRSPGAPALTPTGPGILWAIAFGALAGAAMGVDFPESNRPLARLT